MNESGEGPPSLPTESGRPPFLERPQNDETISAFNAAFDIYQENISALLREKLASGGHELKQVVNNILNHAANRKSTCQVDTKDGTVMQNFILPFLLPKAGGRPLCDIFGRRGN